MSKPDQNPMFGTDFFKAVDFSKIMGDYKMPGFNLAPLFEIQRKNIEAMTTLNQTAMESFQSLAHRQAETIRQSYEDASRIMSNMMAPSANPQDKVMMQAEASKAVMAKCMENAREVSEVVSRYNAQAMQTVTSRISESMQELQGIVSENRNAA